MSHTQNLIEAGRKLAEANAARDEAIALIKTLSKAARKDGVSVSYIARLTGVTRQTIYTLTK